MSQIKVRSRNQFDGTVYYDKMGLRTTAVDASVVEDKSSKKVKKEK